MKKQSSSIKSPKLLHHFHLAEIYIQLNTLFDRKRYKNKNLLHMTHAGDYDDHDEFWGTGCDACVVHAHWFVSLVSLN
jgi:hypothetical protein